MECPENSYWDDEAGECLDLDKGDYSSSSYSDTTGYDYSDLPDDSYEDSPVNDYINEKVGSWEDFHGDIDDWEDMARAAEQEYYDRQGLGEGLRRDEEFERELKNEDLWFEQYQEFVNQELRSEEMRFTEPLDISANLPTLVPRKLESKEMRFTKSLPVSEVESDGFLPGDLI